MKAVVIGATGATGKVLVRQLLADDDYDFVEIFVRNDWDIQHPKLICYVVDFENIEQWKHLIEGDVAFSCLGTTLKDAGSREKQWHIEYDYVIQFAQYCRAQGVRSFVVLSSKGASERSKIFYLKLKGMIEHAILSLHFENTIIVRPSTLLRPNSTRKGEKFSIKLIRFLNRLGLYKSFRPVSVFDVAKCMRKESKQLTYRVSVIENTDI